MGLLLNIIFYTCARSFIPQMMYVVVLQSAGTTGMIWGE